jgi:lipoprotein-anchoring transpeptidase ErfK/SrfK
VSNPLDFTRGRVLSRAGVTNTGPSVLNGGHGGPGDSWVRARLPGRPNSHTGWISTARTRSASTPWRIVVSLSARRVIVFRSGRVVRRFAAIVGKSSTPTPRGTFFVAEALRLSSDASYGCVRLAPHAITWLAHRIGAGVPVSIVASA